MMSGILLYSEALVREMGIVGEGGSQCIDGTRCVRN